MKPFTPSDQLHTTKTDSLLWRPPKPVVVAVVVLRLAVLRWSYRLVHLFRETNMTWNIVVVAEVKEKEAKVEQESHLPVPVIIGISQFGL
jgi:hypothetical protein